MKKTAQRPSLGRIVYTLACLIALIGMSACSAGTPNRQTAITQPPLPTLTSAPAQTATVVNPTSTLAATTIATPKIPTAFDGQRAFKDLEYQMSLGPRVPGSQAHTQVINWMQQELEASGWTVEIQETTRMGHPVRNVIAKRGTQGQWIILGAHFDSRMLANQDPDPSKRNDPVPGADDGASGVAVLLELARVLPKDLNQRIWLTFFDAEDQGDIPGWDWLLGSEAVADSLTSKPDAVIVIDMIGDANLNIYEEKNSNPVLTTEIWDTAARLGYSQQFIPQVKWDMLDDHTPFLQKGIRAVDIIDFDYPYWHTTMDTTDKTSPQSLQIVGDTLLHWIIQTPQK